MSNDLHSKPFDEGTLVKLSLFREYIREWLPVFLAKKHPHWRRINLFDFFSGPGETALGDKGSPAIILEELTAYAGRIQSNKLVVSVFFNEFQKKKFKVLESSVTPPNYLNLKLSNLDFDVGFKHFYPDMKGAANLILLDQSGVKHVNEEVIKSIIALPATDFIMFISSSTLGRFADHPAIKQYVSIPKLEISTRDYYDIHRVVTRHFETFVPKSRKYFLAPFSIKKGANIYGLIFGSGHLLGLKKFLAGCWKADPERGEANFDIDSDRIDRRQPSFFAEMDRPKKVTLFEQELEQELFAGKLKTKAAIEEFALTRGFLPKHTTKSVQIFKKSAKFAEKL